MARTLAGVAAVTLTLTLTGPAAYAHTTADLDAWVDDWSAQAVDGGLSMALVGDYLDMARRHPCYFRNKCAARYSARAVPRVSWTGDVEQWRPLVARYFPGEVDTAMCVMRWESSGNPSARNPSSSAAGLWQFLRDTWNRAAAANGGPTYDQGGPFDPVLATRYAAWLRNRPGSTGWGQWTAYRTRCR